MADIVEAKEPFSVTLPDGRPFVVARGDRFYADDPVVRGREHLFGEITVRRSSPIGAPESGRPEPSETADAPPGTRRARTKQAGGGSRA
jgi:hypothetical protein